MLTPDHLARFAKAAPVEWHPKYLSISEAVWVTIGSFSFTIPAERWDSGNAVVFVGWGVEWLCSKNEAGIQANQYDESGWHCSIRHTEPSCKATPSLKPFSLQFCTFWRTPMPFNEKLIADAHAFLEAHAAATEKGWDHLRERPRNADSVVPALLISGLLARVEELEKALKGIDDIATNPHGWHDRVMHEKMAEIAKAALSEKQ